MSAHRTQKTNFSFVYLKRIVTGRHVKRIEISSFGQYRNGDAANIKHDNLTEEKPIIGNREASLEVSIFPTKSDSNHHAFLLITLKIMVQS